MTRGVNRIKWENWFSLALPEGWVHEEEGSVINIFHPNGVGALTVSLITLTDKMPGRDAAYILIQRFAQQREWRLSKEKLSIEGGGLEAACSAGIVTNGELWSVVAHVNVPTRKAVLMSYVADENDEARERTCREQVFGSFRWEVMQ